MRHLRIFSVMLLLTLVINLVLAQTDQPGALTYIASLDFSPEGNTLAVGYGTSMEHGCIQDQILHSIALIDPTTEVLIKTLKWHYCTVTNLDFSSDGTQLVSSGNDYLTVVWDINSGAPLLNPNQENGRVRGIAWSPSGNKIVYIQSGIGVTITDATAKQAIGGYINFEVELTDTAWSPNGAEIATSQEDGIIRVWDVANHETVIDFHEHTGQVNTVAWNQIDPGDEIASGDVNGEIKIWNALTGVEITSTTAHTGAVNDLMWSADGQILASTGDDGFVRLWMLQTSEIDAQPSLTELTSFDYGAPVYAVAWSPDGAKLAYGGQGVDSQNGQVEIMEVSAVVCPLLPELALCSATPETSESEP